MMGMRKNAECKGKELRGNGDSIVESDNLTNNDKGSSIENKKNMFATVSIFVRLLEGNFCGIVKTAVLGSQMQLNCFNSSRPCHKPKVAPLLQLHIVSLTPLSPAYLATHRLQIISL